ncbi:hypothetical protein BD560DRAFT_487562, partial [Blakeslea trispora]
MLEGEKFDVLAIEVKKPKAKTSQIVNDTSKLGNILKLMLGHSVLLGVPFLIVCGLVGDGEMVTAYKMTIEQEGRYDLVELASFRGIRCLDDLLRLPSIIGHFQQLKNIVLFVKEAIRVTRLKEKNTWSLFSFLLFLLSGYDPHLNTLALRLQPRSKGKFL